MFVCMYVSMSLFVCLSVCLYMYVCLSVCVYVCMYVCMSVCLSAIEYSGGQVTMLQSRLQQQQQQQALLLQFNAAGRGSFVDSVDLSSAAPGHSSAPGRIGQTTSVTTVERSIYQLYARPLNVSSTTIQKKCISNSQASF